MLLVKVQRKAQHALRSTWVWKRDLASRTRPEEKVWHIIAQGIPTMQLGMSETNGGFMLSTHTIKKKL